MTSRQENKGNPQRSKTLKKHITFDLEIPLAESCSTFTCYKSKESWDAWLAPSVECVTLDLCVVSSSPTMGVEIT